MQAQPPQLPARARARARSGPLEPPAHDGDLDDPLDGRLGHPHGAGERPRRRVCAPRSCRGQERDGGRALIGELRASCRNDFGAGEFAACRAKFQDALSAVGPMFLTPGLLLKYAATLLGPEAVARLKQGWLRSSRT